MKKLLILLLAVATLFACEEQSADGTSSSSWDKYMKAMYTAGNGEVSGTLAVVDDEALTNGKFALAVVEYDGASKVGTERGKISDTNKSKVLGYSLRSNDGYFFTIEMGADVTQTGWDGNKLQISPASETSEIAHFELGSILDDKPAITVENEIAIIKIYDDIAKAEANLVATYSLRL